ncbi:MAG: helicase-related protein [Candidatus Thorarchaeota archaeon]|jgi:superfamily II DNA or RNA helicase
MEQSVARWGYGGVELFEGQVISAPFLKEKAEVKKFEKRPGYYLLEVIFLKSRKHKPLRISEPQLKQIKVETAGVFAYSKNSEDFFFWIEANRLRVAHQFDPLLAVNVSLIDPLPHQIEAVYSYALRDPKIRFLIADDAGAGKAIMAGLIIKELQYRNMAKNTLIVAPGHLKYQWQREMKTKFDTNFTQVNRALMESHWSENIWEKYNFCVASIDFLKRDDIAQKLAASTWDLIVVDEAHKMSAYGYSTRKGAKIDKTKRYRVGEILSRIGTHMLFLTATPHRGDEENFRLFLDLLRPGFFSKAELLRESVEKGENPLFVRRLKEDMEDFKGNKLFPPRNVITVSFPLTEDEKKLYSEVTNYVKVYFDKAKENRSITFAMMILQRRLTSSTHAILRSLEKRKERLEELLDLPEKIRQDKDYEVLRDFTEEDLEDMEEEDRWRIEEKVMHLTMAQNVDEIEAEIGKIDELIGFAKVVREKEIESKLVKLRDEILANIGDKKLLIFTEFKDTLDYLEEKLVSWGYKVNKIHGNMKMDARIEAEHRFKNETQIMVATEAAGEGINLQFCSLMVNYDVPWNPNRLEQRMGRIHRYGQDKEVFIYNMVSKDTREGQVLERLFNKLDKMKEALGSDRVFDVIGEVIPGADLEAILRDAITGQRRMEDIYEIVDEMNPEELKKTMKRIFMTSLATRHIDYSGMLQQLNRADENRLMPEYIEDYFLRALKKFGGDYDKGNGTYSIKSVPYDLRKANDDYAFTTRYGKVERTYAKITFDKQEARNYSDYEYVAPGHPLLETVNQKVIDDMGHSEAIAIFGDETNNMEGVIWFIEAELTDGLDSVAGKRIFSVFQSVTGQLRNVNPSILWDLAPTDDVMLDESLRRMFDRKGELEEYAVTEIMFPFKAKKEDERKKEAKIKQKYGMRSLDFLLQESNDKLLHYQQEMEEGKDMKIVIFNEERRKEDLEEKRRKLLEEIERGTQLTVSEPKILGAAAVLPMNRLRPAQKEPLGEDMARNEEIENVGMYVTKKYELDHGWSPEDVHEDNLGFDVRSTRWGEDGKFEDIRYIEVKARAKEGAIRLSANEWKKAKRFGKRFWLYVVTFAGTSQPKLIRIQNPAIVFRIDEDIYATGYIIPKDRIMNVVNK